MNLCNVRCAVLAVSITTYGCADSASDASVEGVETTSGVIGPCAELPVAPESTAPPAYAALNDEELLEIPQVSCPPQVTMIPEVAMDVRIHRPANVTDGPWPNGMFPLIVFEHGNTQNGDTYPGLMSLMVRSGFVVANILSDGTSNEKTRGERIRCVATGLLTTASWSGADRIDGVVLAGHSTGGEGAVRAAQATIQDGLYDVDQDLLAVLTIAPSANSADSGFPLALVPFFTIQGTEDHDVEYQQFAVRDRVSRPEEALGESSGARVAVYAYRVRHNDFGGQDPVGMSPSSETELATALFEEYLIYFLHSEVYQHWPARSRFFGNGLEIPPGLTSLWMPPFALQTPVFGSMTDRAGGDYNRVVLDAFETGGNLMVSSAGGTVDWDPGVAPIQELGAVTLGADGHDTQALRLAASPGSSIRWTIPDEIRNGIASTCSYLTFRLGINPRADLDNCLPTVDIAPAIQVTLADEFGSEATLEINDFVQLHPADVFYNATKSVCHDGFPLQSSIRLPFAEFCSITPLQLDALSELRFTFVDSADVIIDSIEFGGSPGDPSRSDCVCENG
jgi:hypothetical protein